MLSRTNTITKLESRCRRTTRFGALVLVWMCGCASPSGTMIELAVRYEDAWGLSQLRVVTGERMSEVEEQHEVVIGVPDDWAGIDFDLDVWGLRGPALRAHGAVAVTPVAGTTVKAEVVLTQLPCGAWCAPGALACAGEAVVTCARRDDGCYEWSEPQVCGGDTPYCSLGTCLADCIDECAPGETQCAGPDGLQVCGQADQDSCRDWMAVEPCGAGMTCSAGSCRAACTDECTAGETRCVSGGVASCGDANADGCTEWSPPLPCASGVCNGGACAAACTDDCTANTCSAVSWQQCGQYDLDSCMDLSPGTSCVPADPCEVGSCTPASGCAAMPRVCDMPPAPTCVNATTLQSYEAAGTCGAGGCQYPATDTTCPDGCENGACKATTCPETSCTPVTVASGQLGGDGIAQDDTHIYWTSFDGDTVMRRSKSLEATTVETVATGQDGAHGVAVDGTHVYWTSFNGGTVMRRSKTLGAAVETVASGQGAASGIALDGTHVYWTTYYGDTVMRRSKALGATTVETVATGQDGASGIALDGTHVYWTTGLGDTVMRRSKALGATTVETVATGQDGASGIALDGTHVYWTTELGDTVMRRSKALGATTVETVATGQDSASGIALDATHVFWTTYFGDTVMRRSKALGGMTVETVATGQDGAKGIAVDGTHVYWATDLGGTVMRLSRCACSL